MRNKEIDLMKAMGIIYVVGGHYYIHRTFGYPHHTSALPIFYFVSGYFFKSVDGFRLKLSFCFKKTKELLLPYFLYYVLFTMISYFLLIFLSIKTIGETLEVDLLGYPLSLILKPFFGGISIVLAQSWFITDLWIMLITMQIIYHNKNNSKIIDLVYFLCLLSLACAGIHWSSTTPHLNGPSIGSHSTLKHNKFKLVLIRTWMGLIIFFFGMVYRVHIEKYQTILFTGKTFGLAFIAICQLQYYYQDDISYLHYNADFLSAPVWLPILVSFISVFIFLFIAKCLAKHIHNDDILFKIGNETYHILCQHMIIFLFLNVLNIGLFGDKNFKVLDWNAFYRTKPEMNWPLFVGCGVLVPTFSAIYMRRFVPELGKKIHTLIMKLQTTDKKLYCRKVIPQMT